MALRDGFLIPNASTYAPDYQTAQPDQGDFVILGNSQYGVITGCKVSLAGSTVSIGAGPHLAVIAGTIYSLGANQEKTIGGKDADPRFDLVVFDSNTSFTVVPGTPSANPVFPDVTSTMVVLAAIFVPATGGSANLINIDKRNFLQTTLTGVNVSNILRNYDSDGATVKINISGTGKISWNGDTHLERLSPGVLKATDEVRAATLTATGSATVAGEDVITTEYIAWGTTAERNAIPAPDIGDIFVDNVTGDVSVWKTDTDEVDKWITFQPTFPTGTITMSMASSDNMPGWLPLYGQTIDVAEAGNLPSVFPSWVAGDEIVLPDMRGRFPLGGGQIGSTEPGTVNIAHGSRLDDKGTVNVTLSTANLPAHVHRTDTETLSQGSHSHVAQTNLNGGHSHSTEVSPAHNHGINDPGHGHTWGVGWPIVVSNGYHDTCMDLPFVDSAHSYRTVPNEWSNSSTTGISVASGGQHTHAISSEPNHNHVVAVAPAGTHTHTLPEHNSVGGGQAVVFRPPSLSVTFYIKI